MSPGSNSGIEVPAGSRSETIVLSKTDALGDQILAIGLANAILQHHPRARLVWFVRTGNESLASLLKDAHVYRPDLRQPAVDEARKALEGLPTDRSEWNRIVFIPVPLNPYQDWGRDPESRMEWWITFGRSLNADLAVAGSTTRNWLDQVLVVSTMATRRIGFGPSFGSQEIPPEHRSKLHPSPIQELFTEEIPFQEDLNERDRMHLLAGTVTRKDVPYNLTIDPCPPSEPIPLVGVDRVLAVAPGVGDPRRSVESSSLCDGITEFLNRQTEFEKSCLIIEGPVDQAIVSEVSEGLRQRGIATTRLRFDADALPNLVALLKQVALFLTHETFYAQIAAITKTPTVAIWGLGQWRRFFPEADSMTIVHTVMPCRNCRWRCCLDRWRCITDITASAITEGLSNQWRTDGHDGIRFVESPSPVPDEQVITKIRTAAETLLQETQKQRDQAQAWAHDVDKLWRKLQTLHSDLRKKKDEAVRVSQEERGCRESIEAQLQESRRQGDEHRDRAEREEQQRREAESLRTRAEQERDDLRGRAEEERVLRRSAEDSLETEKNRALVLKGDLERTNEILDRKNTMIEKTSEELVALKEELQQTREALCRYDRLLACRLSANIADRWHRATKRTTKK